MFLQNNFKALNTIAIACLLLLQSCASYNDRILTVRINLASENYAAANKEINNTRLLKKNRNRLLYLLEKGKISHLLQQYDSSNAYFNEADRLIESSGTSAKDLLLVGLVNPMLQTYKPEDFEGFMVHYYKALNYLQLGKTEDALVEARRITLTNKRQQDKLGSKENRYGDDAFSLMLQGLIYEKGNDINNAFIAYRNAVDVYLKKEGKYFGVSIPQQLKKDVLRTANEMGFVAEQQRYEKLFNQTYAPINKPAGGELIIFWETGLAPAKAQQTLNFNVIGQNGRFFFTDTRGIYNNIPFDNSIANASSTARLSDIQMFAVALPKYNVQPLKFNTASITINDSNTYQFEKAQNIGTMAVEILQDRFAKELATALTRMALKKLTEIAATPKRDPNKKYKTEEERAKAEKQEDLQELLAIGLKIFNRATEKADTRNWQSLPNSIFYSRIPLQMGENKVVVNIETSRGEKKQKQLTIQGNGQIQFTSIYSIQ
jgi:uncharacterized protein